MEKEFKFDLEPEVMKKAVALLPVLQAVTGPGRGTQVPITAVMPICALIACEEAGSTKVTTKVAQVSACLTPAEFSRAVRNAKAALARSQVHSKNVLGKPSLLSLNVPTVSSSASIKRHPANWQRSLLATANWSRNDTPATSKSSTTLSAINVFKKVTPQQSSGSSIMASPTYRIEESAEHKAEFLLIIQIVDVTHTNRDALARKMSVAIKFLERQNWSAEKWKENEGNLRCAVFYWVCEAEHVEIPALKDVCDMLNAKKHIVERIIESMNVVRPRILALIKDVGQHSTTQRDPLEDPTGSPSPLKRKATSPTPTANPLTEEPNHHVSKRFRREPSDTLPFMPLVDVRPALRTSSSTSTPAETEDSLDGVPLPASPSVPRSQASGTPNQVTTPLRPPKIPPKTPQKTPSKTTPMPNGHITPATEQTTKLQRLLAGQDEQPNTTTDAAPRRYRPVFPDRPFWDPGESEDEETETEAEQHLENLRCWVEQRCAPVSPVPKPALRSAMAR
ncbi:hypothetical protein FRB99_005447 [Tulasnella sp. 403]|nr:hypothetical protein FRB99_005447 [Tulasnella sp. 403]